MNRLRPVRSAYLSTSRLSVEPLNRLDGNQTGWPWVIGILALFVASPHSLFAFGLPLENKSASTHALQTDTPIIVMEFTGGMPVPLPPGFEPTPFLSIYPDGLVETGINQPDQQSKSFRLSRDELNAVFQKFEDADFFEMDSKVIQDKIEGTGKKVLIADAPSTQFSVRRKAGSHTVGVYALSFVKTQMPEVPELAKLKDLENTLRRLHAIALIGGTEQLEHWVEQVNAYLRENDPSIRPIGKEHLRSASIGRTSTLRMSFTHPEGLDSPQSGPVTINVSAGEGPVEIRINR